MKAIILVSAALLNLISIISFSQSSITLQPEKDAITRELAGTGDNTNYGNYAYLNMHAWTNQGNIVVHHSLIDFDLSSIPTGSTITHAKLYLYVDRNSTAYPYGHELLGWSNECLIRRVLENWDEYSVTWNNRPGTTTINQVMIPPSTSNFQDYVIDVTTLIQDMIDDPSHSFGFGIRQRIEYPYRRMVFASRDNSNTTIHPKLIISYTELVDIVTTNPNSLNVSVYPNPANSWVNIEFESKANEKFTMKLFDVRGQLIETTENITTGETKIDTKSLPGGVYFIQLIADRQVYDVKKLMLE